jgi:hypothetical protein
VQIAGDKDTVTAFKSFIDQFHYLGFGCTVGENLKYVVHSNNGTVLSCLLFGSAAWACRARDLHIGWDKKRRSASLHLRTVHRNAPFLFELAYLYKKPFGGCTLLLWGLKIYVE